jgi:proteasome lid subunit RPN8/RPN11
MAIRWTNVATPDRLPVLPERDGLLDIVIDPAVENDVQAHLAAQAVEQGGLLIGRAWWCGTAERPGAVTRVHVTRAVAADESIGSAISLRMETAVWSAARDALQPGELIVGWYHSHPGLTAFFSDTDRQTQRAFFNHDYSVGWVIDPLTGDEALFLGPDCLPVARSQCIR